MIDSPSDYEFVTGITNGQVIINGHILPWRDVNYDPAESPPTDKPECLRGEDVCFLYEAQERLESLFYTSTNTWTYENKLNRNFMYQRAYSSQRFWDETWYGSLIMCASDTYQTTYFQSNNEGVKADFKIAFPNHRTKRADMASDYTYYNLTWDSTLQRYRPVPVSGEQIRRIFYDLYRLRSFVVVQQSTSTSGVTAEHVAEREMGDTRADYDYSGHQGYPYWGSIGTSGYHRSILGESQFHTQRRFNNQDLYFERARSWQASSTGYIEVTSNTGVDYGKYCDCNQALIYLTTSVGNGNNNFPVYTKSTTNGFAVVPATEISDATVRVQMSDLLPAAQAYATSAGVYSQYFTKGRSPMGWLSGLSGLGSIWNSSIYVQA